VSIVADSLTKILTGEVPVTLVKDVSLRIEPGEAVAITGPSGSGKSSLLYLLGVLDSPSSGELYIDNTKVSSLSDSEKSKLRLKHLGFIFQAHFLLPEFTALENVLLPMQRLGELTGAEMIERSKTLLEQVGLSDHISKIPKKLSGGQSQRVAIARALANNPKIILADEPTGNLDSVSSKQVQEILIRLAREFKRTVLVVTHEEEFARSLDRVIRIVDGRIQ